MYPNDRVTFFNGVEAYKQGDLEGSIKLFQELLLVEKENFDCRFYMAMAYARLGKVTEARREFMTVRDFCPNSELRQRAANAFAALTAAVTSSQRTG